MVAGSEDLGQRDADSKVHLQTYLTQGGPSSWKVTNAQLIFMDFLLVKCFMKQYLLNIYYVSNADEMSDT